MKGFEEKFFPKSFKKQSSEVPVGGRTSGINLAKSILDKIRKITQRNHGRKITDEQVNDWIGGIVHYDFQKTINIGNRKITFEKRNKNNLWGRFGGGWNIVFGFQKGGSTLIINLFVMSIRIDKK